MRFLLKVDRQDAGGLIVKMVNRRSARDLEYLMYNKPI